MATIPSKAKNRDFKSHSISGGGGVKLYVEETGNPKGKPILFLHGFSQHRLCWLKQIDSSLTDDFRLVILDMRGHGLSEKPYDAYTNGSLWADDIHAVIAGLGLTNPILSGWSNGGLIICDYLRYYGEDKIGGLHFVGSYTKFGKCAKELFCPTFNASLVSPDVVENVQASQVFVKHLTHQELPAEDFHFFLGCNLVVPPYVRQGLADREQNNDDILPRIRKPVLLTHGQQDNVVKVESSKQNAAVIKHAKTSFYDNVGHMPFWEATPRFNRELRAFVNSC